MAVVTGQAYPVIVGGGGAAIASGSGAGGSGVVVIKIPDTKTATFTGGVTENKLNRWRLHDLYCYGNFNTNKR
jgi:hypothetical protein